MFMSVTLLLWLERYSGHNILARSRGLFLRSLCECEALVAWIRFEVTDFRLPNPLVLAVQLIFLVRVKNSRGPGCKSEAHVASWVSVRPHRCRPGRSCSFGLAIGCSATLVALGRLFERPSVRSSGLLWRRYRLRLMVVFCSSHSRWARRTFS